MKPLKKLAWTILNSLRIGASVQLILKSGLLDDGWFRSFHTKESVDRKGRPIPWWTYTSIKFIQQRLRPSHIVFEYGCGHSTLWLARHVKSVHSVEHDGEWLKKITPQLPHNASVHLQPLDNMFSYAKYIAACNQKFDIIVIDGRERNACVDHALDSLTEEGIIVFDNAELEEYASALQKLLDHGFKRIDFEGNLPIVPHYSMTSLFYRNQNCFNI